LAFIMRTKNRTIFKNSLCS